MAAMLIPSLISLLLSLILPAFAADTLAQGDHLTPSSPPLTSPQGSFILSFRPFAASSSSSLYLAISFSSSPNSHPAWVANRDQPASSSSASLELSPNGSLTLSDSSGVLWSVSNYHVVTAQLLDSGNFVLFNRSSAVWHSFDHPTDTLLPSQRFVPGETLTSQARADSFKSGSAIFQFDTNGVASLSDKQVYSDETQNYAAIYWSLGGVVANTSAAQLSYLEYDRYGNLSLYHSGVVNSSCFASDYGSPAIRRLTLDLDGNLRMYSWHKPSARWIRVWLAVENLCRSVRSLCGQYGICILDPEPVCVCPPGFHPRDQADISQGCTPTSPLNCTSTDYVALESTDFPFHDYKDFTGVTEASCKSQCSSSCSCLAAIFWQTSTDSGHCWLKAQLLNGYSFQSQKFLCFLKISGFNQSALTAVPDNGTHWSSDGVWQGSAAPAILSVNYTNLRQVRNSSKSIIVVMAGVIAVQLAGFVAFLACFNRRNARRLKYAKLHGDLEGVSGSPTMFSYQELDDATNHFSQMLGSGGFGTVYMGRLPNGKAVAVKRLEGLTNRESQFRSEIATIGKIHHINLLRLSGFCADGEHRLLVYEYMENGSLDAMLFRSSEDDKVLDWKTRFQICLGVARGITYLHEECLDCILHCDIKPQNILLDKSNCAKVADFGLAFLFSREHTVKVTSIRGTRGYLAPEWVANRPITAKADVFSYGMLLFEIVSGRSNYIFTSSTIDGEENEKWCFPMWAYARKVEEVVDERLGGNVDYKQAEAVLKVAFLCIQGDMKTRPSMGKVVQMLEGTLSIREAPPPLLDGACFNELSRHDVSGQSFSGSIQRVAYVEPESSRSDYTPMVATRQL